MSNMNSTALCLAPADYFYNQDEIARNPERAKLYLRAGYAQSAPEHMSTTDNPPPSTFEEIMTQRPWYLGLTQKRYEKIITQAWNLDQISEYKAAKQAKLEKELHIPPSSTPPTASIPNAIYPWLAPRENILTPADIRQGANLQFYLPPGYPRRETAYGPGPEGMYPPQTFGDLLERLPWYVGLTRAEYEAVVRLGWEVERVAEWKGEMARRGGGKGEKKEGGRWVGAVQGVLGLGRKGRE